MSDECPKPCPTCEIERAARHHDVLCRVLDKLVDAALSRPLKVSELLDIAPEHVRIANAYANLAYPPPKAEGT